jgi:hypothetical protein
VRQLIAAFIHRPAPAIFPDSPKICNHMSGRSKRTRTSNPRHSSQGTSNNVSKHPYSPSIDATTVPSLVLSREISGHHSLFSASLDFVKTPDSKIKSLFYKPERHDKRSIDEHNQILFPPPTHRRTAAQIRTFFEYGLGAKKQIIHQSANDIIDTSNLINYIDSEFACDGHSATNDSESIGEESIKSDAAVDHPMDQDESSTEENVEQEMCVGVDLEYITNMKLDKESRDARMLGFKHTVREGYTTRTRLEHPNNIGFQWPFCLPVVGVLVNGNKPNEIVWTIREKECYNNICTEDDGPDFGRYSIHHVDCVGGAIVKQGLCSSCLAKKKLLTARFHSNFVARNQGVDINSRSTIGARTYSLQQGVTDHYKKRAKNLSKRLSYKQRALDKLTEEQGMTVEINETSDSIFNYDVAQNVKRFLAADPNDRTNAIADFVFRESVKKYLENTRAHAVARVVGV